MIRKLPELLVPAGGKEQLEAAIIYGADAVYLGGEGLNLRLASHGFTDLELEQSLEKAHKNNVKVYYCLNALPYDFQIENVVKRLESLANMNTNKVDALIIADPGVIELAKEICPHIEIHLSTQAHSVNAYSAKFWEKQGITRVNLARELKFSDIQSILKQVPHLEFEVFMHGAMCLALSGHCLLSMWANKRAANLGHCSQPCRFKYKGMSLNLHEASLQICEEKRPNTLFWEAEENEEFSTIWAPEELCLIRYLTWFIQNNVAALKIEGRTKSAGYVAQVTDIYRTALTRTQLSFKEKQMLPYSLSQLISELASAATRPLSTGFFLPERKTVAAPQKNKRIVGRILEQLAPDAWLIDVRDTWHSAQEVEIMVPGYKRPTIKNYTFENTKKEKTGTLHPGTKGIFYTENNVLQPHFYIRSSI